MATLEELKARREELRKEADELNKKEAALWEAFVAKQIAAAAHQSNSEVGDSQPEAESLFASDNRIIQCYNEIAKIDVEIFELSKKGGRRRKTRRHRRKQRKTLRRK